MRYSAAEKHEIITLVEKSSLSARRTLAQLDIPKSTFSGWYDRFVQGGIEALEDGTPAPKRVWNKIPDQIGDAIVDLALKDLGFALGFGREFGVPLDLASATHQTYIAAKAAYGGEAQSPMIAKLLEDLLSTDLRAPGFPSRLE